VDRERASGCCAGWRYLVGDGHDQALKGRQVFGVAHVGRVPRDVDVETLAGVDPHIDVVSVFRVGEEGAVVIAVDRDVENAIIGRGECRINNRPFSPLSRDCSLGS